MNYFMNSEMIQKFFIETVIKFYVEIETAGSGMFFTKFQYRHDCSKIFQRFWKNPQFRLQTNKMVSTQTFEKFLNCLINDMTYCLEEGIVKIEKIKKFELESDLDPTKVSKEDSENH
jgi:hypothetical protein